MNLETAVQWPQEIAKISKIRSTEEQSVHPKGRRKKTFKVFFLCVLNVLSRLNCPFWFEGLNRGTWILQR